MHIEKIFFDNIFNTVMNVSGKTKDNEKARMDLALYCRWKNLELKLGANGKLLKPKNKLHFNCRPNKVSLSMDKRTKNVRWLFF